MRDSIVNISGLVLVAIVVWKYYVFKNGGPDEKMESQRQLSVLIPILVIYLFSTPIMYPDGDLWAAAIIDPLIGTSSSSFGGSEITDLMSGLTQSQPNSLLDEVILWLKVIGMIVHIIVFLVMSLIPRAIVVGYDEMRELLGIDND